MARGVPATDVLLTIMGAPHESDLVTSALRLTQALLEADASVQVWACGYATMLTQESHGATKPRNLVEWSVDYPSTVTLVRELLTAFPERMYWYGCRACSDDRGATSHIPEVRVQPPTRFAAHVAAAGRTIFLGVM
jgi:sulfur relay (sulfurtransferase) complex TusBCD TusD component (DsrE family)